MVGLGQWGPGLPVRATLSSPGLGQVPPVQIGVLWIEQPAPPATPVEGNLLVARGEMAASDQVTWLLARLSWGLRAVASRPADPHRLSPPPGLSPPTPFFLGRTRAGGDENLGRFKFLILPGEQRLTQPGWERLPRRGHVGGLSAVGLGALRHQSTCVSESSAVSRGPVGTPKVPLGSVKQRPPTGREGLPPAHGQTAGP